MKVAVTDALRSLARHHRIFTADPGHMWPLGGSVFVGDDALIEPYSHLLGGAVIPRRFGAFSYTHSPFDSHTSIGRYSSISWRVTIMGSAHPSQWASLHPFSHNQQPLHGIRAYLLDHAIPSLPKLKFDQGPQEITIGHDVWIGAETMIKRGVTIGDGAVIGTRSLVTKDVPPYAIVGGAPARLIRYRFDEAMIERLQASQWWRYGPDVLQDLDVRDPAGFLDRLQEREALGDIQPLDLEPLTAKAIIEASVVGRTPNPEP
jgi:acetyltransferase-like isoleucine patch superfamily enzyme